jgi:hypothetical protein
MSQYSVIESDRVDELVEAVSQALQDGWRCEGGVSIWYEPGTDSPGGLSSMVHYAQALVRESL